MRPSAGVLTQERICRVLFSFLQNVGNETRNRKRIHLTHLVCNNGLSRGLIVVHSGKDAGLIAVI